MINRWVGEKNAPDPEITNRWKRKELNILSAYYLHLHIYILSRFISQTTWDGQFHTPGGWNVQLLKNVPTVYRDEEDWISASGCLTATLCSFPEYCRKAEGGGGVFSIHIKCLGRTGHGVRSTLTFSRFSSLWHHLQEWGMAVACAWFAPGLACCFHLCGLSVLLWHHICFLLRNNATGLAATLSPGKVAKHTLNVVSEWAFNFPTSFI